MMDTLVYRNKIVSDYLTDFIRGTGIYRDIK